MSVDIDIDLGAAQARVGRTLRGKWHLDALIDVGGMAAVYAATHRNGMRGAVKVLHPEAQQSEQARARFMSEGYIANQITHPNAVRVLDDDVDEDGNLFVVMELLRGATLQECVTAAGGRLAVGDVLLIADQLLDVLAAAHALGIVHRDVKPENVFLTTDGRVKVLDFGVAGFRERQGAPRAATIAGLVMGSPAYMAPEQARGRWDIVDARSDVWSCGATLFMMLAGRPARTEETIPELLAAAVLKPVGSLADAAPDIPPAVVEIIDRALRMDPAERWPDARTMRAALCDAYRALFGAPLPNLVADAVERTRGVDSSGPGSRSGGRGGPPSRPTPAAGAVAASGVRVTSPHRSKGRDEGARSRPGWAWMRAPLAERA